MNVIETIGWYTRSSEAQDRDQNYVFPGILCLVDSHNFVRILAHHAISKDTNDPLVRKQQPMGRELKGPTTYCFIFQVVRSLPACVVASAFRIILGYSALRETDLANCTGYKTIKSASACCCISTLFLFNAQRIQPVKMSATFVETASSGQAGSPTLTHGGAYKEIAPISFSEDNERRGTETTPPASYPHYLPVWDEKTK